MSDYLTRDEVAERYRLSTRTLERCGPAFCKIGRRVVYKVSEVEAWLDAHRVEGPAATRPIKRGRPTKAEQIRRREVANRNQTTRTCMIGVFDAPNVYRLGRSR